MTPSNVNIINGVVLVALGLWGASATHFEAPTAFIPVVLGALMLAIAPFFKPGNKLFAHIAVTLALLGVLGLLKPLMGAMNPPMVEGVAQQVDPAKLFRVGFQWLTCLVAMGIYIKSFVDARRNAA